MNECIRGTDESTGTHGPRRDATQHNTNGTHTSHLYGTHAYSVYVYEYSNIPYACIIIKKDIIIGHMVFNSTRDSSYRGSRRQKRPGVPMIHASSGR